MQLVEKISTPAVTMDTATLMDESREIDTKIESDEYLEEFRVDIDIYHSEQTHLCDYLDIENCQ